MLYLEQIVKPVIMMYILTLGPVFLLGMISILLFGGRHDEKEDRDTKNR